MKRVAQTIRRSALTILAAGAGLLGANPAAAATCGIVSSGTSTAEVPYDPFNPTGLGSTQITLQLQRINGGGGEKTDIVNFYLRAGNANANGTQIVANSVVVEGNVEGLGYDVFYDSTETPPIVSPTSVSPTAANKFLKIYFTGNNPASDYATVNFTVTLPPNLNLTSSANLSFDAVFGCSTTGGGNPTQQTGQIPNAITFPIRVLSALQASYAGTSLDFGEIGNVTTPDVQTSPGSYRTPNTNYVRVQSSGPYQVDLTSQNGYRMTFPGGNLGDPNQRVNYSLKFLGETRSATAATAISKVCTRAGVGTAFEDHLFIQATLQEGGQGKMVAPNYRDILTVVVSPLSVPDPGLDCNAFVTP